MFPNFRKHRQGPLKLPAGVHDEDDGEVESVQGEDETAQDGGDGVQQGVEPLLSGPPVRDQTHVTSTPLLNILLKKIDGIEYLFKNLPEVPVMFPVLWFEVISQL